MYLQDNSGSKSLHEGEQGLEVREQTSLLGLSTISESGIFSMIISTQGEVCSSRRRNSSGNLLRASKKIPGVVNHPGKGVEVQHDNSFQNVGQL